jgi:hypothetical protein
MRFSSLVGDRRLIDGLVPEGLDVAAASRPDHDLDRLAVVHRPVAVGNPVEAHRPVEDAAGFFAINLKRVTPVFISSLVALHSV